MARRLTVQISGRRFGTLSEAATHFGVSLQTAARRLRDGWTPDQAFGVAAPPPRLLLSRGVGIKTSAGEFRTFGDAEKHFGCWRRPKSDPLSGVMPILN
jgi:hypothetical protein